MGEAEAAAHTLGLDVVRLAVRRAEDFPPAFDAFKDRMDALLIRSSARSCKTFIRSISERLIKNTDIGRQLPIRFENRESDISIWANGDFSIWRLHAEIAYRMLRNIGGDLTLPVPSL